MRTSSRYDGSDGPRVAIAHDYLTQRGGAEKVVLSMSRAFPDAPIYTLLYDPDNTYPEFADRDIRVSPLNRFSVFRRHHRAALPILPLFAGAMRVDADVVVVSSSGWAHGFGTRGPKSVPKIVHCHSPARWLYLRDLYLGADSGLAKRLVLALTSWYLRIWDRRAAASCRRYFAVSTLIKDRIADAYGIDADVLFSPVAMSSGPVPGSTDAPAETAALPALTSWLADPRAGDSPGSGFFLCVSRLLPYKNVDAVVEAFAGRPERLVVVGRGPDAERIAALRTPNVLMLSDLSDAQLAGLYRDCRALIAASYEDYGLTPIEAGMWGRPAVVLRWGGFLDTVADGVSGMFFDEPTASAIAGALDRFVDASFDPEKIRAHVAQFSEQRYAERLHDAVDAAASGAGA